MTEHITPQEAHDLLDIWEDDESGLLSNTADATQNYGTLFGAAPRLAATIAEMQMEYAVEVDFMDGPLRYTAVNNYGDQWTRDKREAEETLYFHQVIEGRTSTLHTRYVLRPETPQ